MLQVKFKNTWTGLTRLLKNSLLVVAHPDDECLWFSSVMAKVESVITCYEEHPAMAAVGENRRSAMAKHPLSNLKSLGLREPNTFFTTDWETARATRYGIRQTNAAATRRYRESFCLLRKALSDRVRGYSNVITHNPWGEYGHADHALVYRAILSLRDECGFDLWFSNYCSVHCVPHYASYVSGFKPDYQTLATDPDLGSRLRDHYLGHGCWTWYEDHRWFAEESFVRVPDTVARRQITYGSLMPINLTVVDFLPRRDGLRSRIRRWLADS